MTRKPFAVRRGDVQGYLPPKHPNTVNYKLVCKETVSALQMEVNISETEATGMAEEHYHDKSEQVYCLIEGRCMVEVDGETAELAPGDMAFFAPGKRHKITPIGGPTKAIVIFAPPVGDMTSPSTFKG